MTLLSLLHTFFLLLEKIFEGSNTHPHMSNLRITEGAILVGSSRADAQLRRFPAMPQVTTSHTDSCQHGQSALCMGQDGKKALKSLATYYFEQAQRLPPASSLKQDVGLKAEGEEGDNDNNGTPTVCLTGIITAVPDVIDQIDTMQWELTPIDNIHSLESVQEALEHISAPEEHEKRRVVSLYPKKVPRFTGVYKGALVRVTGVPFKFDTSGNPSTVGLTKIDTPQRPTFPWSASTKDEPTESTGLAAPSRMLFVAGPFDNSFLPVRYAIQTAATRGANMLVITGPFVGAPPKEQDLLIQEGITTITFEDRLSALIDMIEEELEKVRKMRNAVPLSVYLVPSMEDVSCMPILPQVAFPLGSGEGWHCVSNPVTVEATASSAASDPLRVRVCAANAVDAVNEMMCERWTDRVNRISRASEAVVASRLVLPITNIPSSSHNLVELGALKITDGSQFPHIVVTTTSRVQSFGSMTHSTNTELGEAGDGCLFIALATGGRDRTSNIFSFQGVEVTIGDTAEAAKKGLGGGRAIATVLTIDGML